MTEHMTPLETTWLSVSEFTQVAGLQQTQVISLVEVGVLKPIGQGVHDWVFDSAAMTLARRLRRIREDLELDLDVHALALGFRLLERISELESDLRRTQVSQLQDQA